MLESSLQHHREAKRNLGEFLTSQASSDQPDPRSQANLEGGAADSYDLQGGSNLTSRVDERSSFPPQTLEHKIVNLQYP